MKRIIIACVLLTSLAGCTSEDVGNVASILLTVAGAAADNYQPPQRVYVVRTSCRENVVTMRCE